MHILKTLAYTGFEKTLPGAAWEVNI